jgi:hypothetical protein
VKRPKRQDLLDALVKKYIPKGEPKPNGHDRNGDHTSDRPLRLGDDEIIELCRRAKNAPKIAALFDDNDTSAYNGDESRADQALISELAFYTDDPEQLFRHSTDRRSGAAEPTTAIAP